MSWHSLREELPTARKPHRCCLCGLEISMGERYVRRVGFRDGKRDAFAMHLNCKDATRDWDAASWEMFDEAEFRGEMESRQAEKSWRS